MKIMKLIIQIPCFNEEATLATVLKELPRKIKGIQKVEWLVINDGSTDGTVETARKNGVDHIVSFTKNQGLARGFMAGLDACVRLGADIIVNTDADNQYDARDIPKLVRPVMEGRADIVIGERPIADMSHFSILKKLLQKLGSWVVRIVSRTSVPDAPSGFRALSREAAMRLNVFNDYTYTLETIIQAGLKNMAVLTVPVRVNTDLRPSRLVKSVFSYITRSVLTVIRIFVIYKPFVFFMSIGAIFITLGSLIGIRFLYYYFTDINPTGKTQSLILASILLGIGFQTVLVAFLADLLATNRKIMEDIQYRLRKSSTEQR